jgi:hypothetical protein
MFLPANQHHKKQVFQLFRVPQAHAEAGSIQHQFPGKLCNGLLGSVGSESPE